MIDIEGFCNMSRRREYPSKTIYWAIVGSMFAQRRRRWTNIEPAMVQCINVVDGGPTLNQQWLNVSCLLGLFYVAFCTIMAISRQQETRSRDYALLLFRIISRVLYSAPYHRQHCTPFLSTVWSNKYQRLLWIVWWTAYHPLADKGL